MSTPQFLTYTTVQALLPQAKPHERVRILAARDPLRNVPAGNFTLDDYSYDAANLCHGEFGNCALLNLGKVA